MNLFQHFTVLLVVLCALTLLTAEARKQHKRGKGKGKRGKAKGKENNRKCKDEKTEDGGQENKVTVCPLNCRKTAANPNIEVVDAKLKATQADLDFLAISLEKLVTEKSLGGQDDAYVEYGTEELYPMNKIKLSSDKKFKLLGQMTWWMTWIEASLRILQKIMQRVEAKNLNSNLIVPVVTDDDNGKVFSINSTLKALLQVKSQLNDLHFNLKHKIRRRKNPFRCQTVKVMQACNETQDPECSEERNRAYIMLRGAHKAVERMQKALRTCEVKKEDKKTVLECTENKNGIFYQKKCQKTMCGMQKMSCKCISWTYE